MPITPNTQILKVNIDQLILQASDGRELAGKDPNSTEAKELIAGMKVKLLDQFKRMDPRISTLCNEMKAANDKFNEERKELKKSWRELYISILAYEGPNVELNDKIKVVADKMKDIVQKMLQTIVQQTTYTHAVEDDTGLTDYFALVLNNNARDFLSMYPLSVQLLRNAYRDIDRGDFGAQLQEERETYQGSLLEQNNVLILMLYKLAIDTSEENLLAAIENIFAGPSDSEQSDLYLQLCNNNKLPELFRLEDVHYCRAFNLILNKLSALPIKDFEKILLSNDLEENNAEIKKLALMVIHQLPIAKPLNPTHNERAIEQQRKDLTALVTAADSLAQINMPAHASTNGNQSFNNIYQSDDEYEYQSDNDEEFTLPNYLDTLRLSYSISEEQLFFSSIPPESAAEFIEIIQRIVEKVIQSFDRHNDNERLTRSLEEAISGLNNDQLILAYANWIDRQIHENEFDRISSLPIALRAFTYLSANNDLRLFKTTLLNCEAGICNLNSDSDSDSDYS